MTRGEQEGVLMEPIETEAGGEPRITMTGSQLNALLERERESVSGVAALVAGLVFGIVVGMAAAIALGWMA